MPAGQDRSREGVILVRIDGHADLWTDEYLDLVESYGQDAAGVLDRNAVALFGL